jgi:hypothetical protein
MPGLNNTQLQQFLLWSYGLYKQTYSGYSGRPYIGIGFQLTSKFTGWEQYSATLGYNPVQLKIIPSQGYAITENSAGVMLNWSIQKAKNNCLLAWSNFSQNNVYRQMALIEIAMDIGTDIFNSIPLAGNPIAPFIYHVKHAEWNYAADLLASWTWYQSGNTRVGTLIYMLRYGALPNYYAFTSNLQNQMVFIPPYNPLYTTSPKNNIPFSKTNTDNKPPVEIHLEPNEFWNPLIDIDLSDYPIANIGSIGGTPGSIGTTVINGSTNPTSSQGIPDGSGNTIGSYATPQDSINGSQGTYQLPDNGQGTPKGGSQGSPEGPDASPGDDHNDGGHWYFDHGDELWHFVYSDGHIGRGYEWSQIPNDGNPTNPRFSGGSGGVGSGGGSGGW